MTEAKPATSALRRRMIDDMTLRNLSPATQRSYLHAVAKFSRHFGCSPVRLGLEDVRSFQLHLVSQGISWPALNQTVCPLRFSHGVTMDCAEIPERIIYARTPRKLPTILGADEVVRFLEAVPSLKTRVALTTAYVAGLRASEAVSLKVADIDSARMMLQVRHGKGAKDRTVMLSAALLTILRSYWRLARQSEWLFHGRGPDKPIDVQVLHSACRAAIHSASAQNTALRSTPGYRWRVELFGPTERCRVPARIPFSVADAIIGGRVLFNGRVYWPRGRMEDDGRIALTLIRTSVDRRPLVHVEGAAGGPGRWSAALPGCAGAARIMPR